jgi:hypothetical protein
LRGDRGYKRKENIETTTRAANSPINDSVAVEA